MTRDDLALTLNAVLVFILCGVLLSAFGVQFLEHEEPCPLCMLQRVAMLGVAIGALFNLKFGIHASHYGLSLLSSLVGGTVALRQISLHVCPGMPGFGIPVLGLSLYTWSFIVFACSILSVALLMVFLYPDHTSTHKSYSLTTIGKTAFVLTFLIALGNVITTYLQCGLGPCTD
jgi:disulfide bond formation protein DsbB